MKLTIEADCTPQEARAFLGLPDLAPLNDHLVNEMTKRLDANISLLQPDEMMKSWMSLGGQAQDQFMKLMTLATSGGLGASKPVKP